MKFSQIKFFIVNRLRSNKKILDFSLFVYFFLLALRNNILLTRKMNKIYLRKKGLTIIINSNSGDFGATGIVVRDYDNFFNSIVVNNGIIDFSTPSYQLMTNGSKYFFHDICEPLTTTKIYLDVANLTGQGEIVLDLGAYCGTQTVDYSFAVGAAGKVIAFEPDNTSYSSLQENIKNATNSNIVIYKKAVYSHDGVIKFRTTGGMASSVVKEDDNNQYKENDEFVILNQEVQCITLDTIARVHNLERCDFIKMDIEGSELEVLKSSVKFINKYNPSFIIEPHKINGKMNTEEIIDFFKSINYKCEKLKQGAQTYQPLLFARKN
jgi:FkbM family methyltransferase